MIDALSKASSSRIQPKRLSNEDDSDFYSSIKDERPTGISCPSIRFHWTSRSRSVPAHSSCMGELRAIP